MGDSGSGDMASSALEWVKAGLGGPRGLAEHVFGEAADRALESYQRRTRERASHSMHAAEEVTGLTREELGRKIASNPDLVSLTARILHAAGLGGASDEALDAMGWALGQAVKDSNRVTAESAFLDAIKDTGPMHTQVLLAISEPRQDGLTWGRDSLQEALSLDEDTLAVAIGGLVGSGMVEQPGAVLDGPGYAITPLGRLLLDVLRARLKAHPDSAQT